MLHRCSTVTVYIGNFAPDFPVLVPSIQQGQQSPESCSETPDLDYLRRRTVVRVSRHDFQYQRCILQVHVSGSDHVVNLPRIGSPVFVSEIKFWEAFTQLIP